MEGDEHTRRLKERAEEKEDNEKCVQIARDRGLMPPQGLLPYFSETSAYVLSFEVEPRVFDFARIEMGGWGGQLMQVFMSPIDALIAGAFRTKPGLRYNVAWAGAVGCKRFLAADGSAVAALHVSWLAHAGQLLLRPDGIPCSCSRVIRSAASGGDEPEKFEVDARSHAELDGVYEKAGLYAWRDTAVRCTEWIWSEPGRRDTLVEKAVRAASARARAGVGQERYELALFDPEFEQWHFTPVPVDAAIEGGD